MWCGVNIGVIIELHFNEDSNLSIVVKCYVDFGTGNTDCADNDSVDDNSVGDNNGDI